MHLVKVRTGTVSVCGWLLFAAALVTGADKPHEDLLRIQMVPGRYGGTLVIPQRAEAKTLNPVTSLDRLVDRSKHPSTPCKGQIDTLMRRKMTTLDQAERKRPDDRVQQILAEQLPLICLASPNVLVVARKDLGNFQPAPLDHYTLWDVEQLSWRGSRRGESSSAP